MTAQIADLHDGLKMLPQVAAHAATNTPDLRSIFTPQSHEGALDPSREIVVGDRGVGKSFWSSVLKDDVARTAIAPVYMRLHLEKLNVSLGFSEGIGRTEYPSARTLSSLLASSIAPDVIWRSTGKAQKSNPACQFTESSRHSTKRTVSAFMSASGHKAKFNLTHYQASAQLLR
jgi:hypothetical protein